MDDAAGRLLPTVTVRGEGIVEVVPDEARLALEVREEARTREGALSGVRERMARLDELLGELDVPEDRRASTVSVGEKGERDGTRWLSKGFRATARLDVTLEGQERLGPLVSGAVERAEAEVDGPWWSISRDHPALAEACEAASADARAKAAAYAVGVGATLGPVLRIVEPGVRTISPVEPPIARPAVAAAMAAEPSRAAGLLRGARSGDEETVLPELDLTPGRRRVQASVEVMFQLEAGSARQ